MITQEWYKQHIGMCTQEMQGAKRSAISSLERLIAEIKEDKFNVCNAASCMRSVIESVTQAKKASEELEKWRN